MVCDLLKVYMGCILVVEGLFFNGLCRFDWRGEDVMEELTEAVYATEVAGAAGNDFVDIRGSWFCERTTTLFTPRALLKGYAFRVDIDGKSHWFEILDDWYGPPGATFQCRCQEVERLDIKGYLDAVWRTR